MKVDIKVPAVGESITEATVSEWVKKSGDAVKRDDVLLTLETDKASVEVVAENDGVLSTSAEEGSVVKVGAVVGQIDTEGKAANKAAPEKAAAPAPSVKTEAPKAGPGVAPRPAPQPPAGATAANIPLSPAVKRVVDEKGLNPATIQGTGKGGRLTKGDVLEASPNGHMAPAPQPRAEIPPLPVARNGSATEEVRREPMTTIRKRIAERLVEAQHTAAILTTFNEVDMSALLALRTKYKDQFNKKYGVNLGFMGFFVKACVEALKTFPKVNAFIDGTDMVFHNYYNVGIAVGTEKGLIVPVIKHAENLSLSDVELTIRHYAGKAREGKITVDDLSGGTFTITNGGVFGSLMSTPILNPPQSAILGMHKVEDRAVVINGKIEVRPMMYLALSYDHRIIDGQESVSFLVKVKECIEDPSRILLEI